MFDMLCADYGCWRKLSRKIPPPPAFEHHVRSYDFMYWEEHCVECAQPQCYSVCPLYERGNDWKCKRMEYGFIKWQAGKAGEETYTDCTLRKWGKIEGVYSGGHVSPLFIEKWESVDSFFVGVVRWLSRVMRFLPGRIGPSTIYRRLRAYAMKMVRTRFCISNILAFQCYSDSVSAVHLHFSIISNDQEVFHQGLEIPPGWTQRLIVLPELKKGARLFFFSNSEATCRLVFRELAVCDGDVAKKKSQDHDALPTQHSIKRAEFVKCIAWDLDNTLWRGILTEDGAERLQLNEQAVTIIKELDKRGVLHTILSKNDFDNAWPVMERFDIAQYFLHPHINWEPKSNNLREIAKMLNIGVDSVAFIDDSAFERAEVGENIPEVRVFSELQIGALLTLSEFNPPVSVESSERRLSYRNEISRKQAEHEFVNGYIDFLKSCNIRLELFYPMSQNEIERCVELIQRSNQLNLTGKRYSREAFSDLIGIADNMPLAVSCNDRFGSYGIVAFLVIGIDCDRVRILEFAISCRVAKKKCEQAILSALVERFALLGIRELWADLVKTGRNQPLIDVFNELPFKQTPLDISRIRFSSDLTVAEWGSEGIADVRLLPKTPGNCGSAIRSLFE